MAILSTLLKGSQPIQPAVNHIIVLRGLSFEKLHENCVGSVITVQAVTDIHGKLSMTNLENRHMKS